jgi:hypothetical protein
MGLFLNRMMRIATFCPILPVRSEIMLALLLSIYLFTELVAPIAFQIISAALFVPFGIAVAVSGKSHQADEDVPSPSPFRASLAPRAPPVS